MITVPIVLNHKDIAVYPDDQDCNLFYCIRTTPRIRKMENGVPVFSGLFWTDDATGKMDSVAGLAGGWINFDANLGISEEEEEELREKIKQSGIQDSVRKQLAAREKERQMLKEKITGEKASQDSSVGAVGEIRFGSINFTDASVVLLEESNGSTVEWSSAGGKSSMFGDNNAAFALTLTPMGAAVWYKCLKEGSKAIGIRYDLKFEIRMPSLEIRAYAGSHQSAEVHREVERVTKNLDKGCTDADVEHIDVKSITQTFVDNGFINIEIKKGSSAISSEYVSQIRESVMNILQAKIEEIIKSRIQGMTPEEREKSMLELVKEELDSFVELNFTQEDVIEWSIAPQGTIMDFLEDIPEDKKQAVTRLVDLADPVVSTKKVTVDVTAPWDDTPFATTVKVDLEYPSNGEKKSFLFKKGDSASEWLFRRPSGDTGVVKYTASAYFAGHAEPYVFSGQTVGDVHIHVGKIGVMDMTFRPHPNLATLSGRNKVTSIQVDMKYVDEKNTTVLNDSLVLSMDKLEGERYQKDLGFVINRPVLYTVTYYFKTREPLSTTLQRYYLTEDGNAVIYTPFPFQDSMDVNVDVPFTPGSKVSKVAVEFKYTDEANAFESVDRVLMTKEDGWEPVCAHLVIVDKMKKDFKYKYTLYTDEDILKGDWLDGQGEAETLVLPFQRIMVGIQMIGLGTDYMSGYLHIESKDGSVNKELFMTPDMTAKMVEWYIGGRDLKDMEFSYQMTLFDTTGAGKEFSGCWKGAMFVIPKPEAKA